MARVALALCLLLALAAARAAPSDYAWEEEQEAAAAEEAEEEGYQQRANSEPLTQQLEDSQVVQDSDEGTLSRLTSEAQAEQQFEQQAGQLQQSDQQLQQQNQYQQNTQQTQGLPDRLVNPSQNVSTGYNPSRERGGDDFGIVGGNGNVQQQQPPQSDGQQFPASHPPQRPRPGQTNPPAGYTQLGFFGYFKVFLTPVTWPEALMTCFADGAQLVVPTDEREALTVGEFYGKVKNQVKKSTDKDLFFIGASDVHKENSFVTLLGTTFGQRQWFRWQKGEPNNHKKVEHCVLSNDKGYYWDGNCQNKYAFVCQFKDRCLPGSPRSDQYRDQTQSQSRY
ncbi:Hemolymph lipopolysaccharide-binding protein [Gryllus bimaculatus]|nr:Hemolymph lipopolysaccharide-binding protein [Gryllus bimaculatus]